MRDVDHWVAFLLVLLVLLVVIFANYYSRARAEIGDLEYELSVQPTPPAVVIGVQEMERLVCPNESKVYTTTEGVVGGFAVECK